MLMVVSIRVACNPPALSKQPLGTPYTGCPGVLIALTIIDLMGIKLEPLAPLGQILESLNL
jgi:hypothetical protein